MLSKQVQVAMGAVALHISIGSVYAWSVFSKPLQQQLGWSLKEVNFTFGLAIFFLGISAAFLGHYVEKHGPRKSARLAATLFGVGLLGSGLAIKMENIWLLYTFYGIVGGMGLGVGYVAPVSTLVKWFPDKRGLATGLAIMGFGFAAAIASPVMRYLIDNIGIANTFLTLGAVYGFVMFMASIPLEAPTKKEGQEETSKYAVKNVQSLYYMTANEAIKTPFFYFLWIMLFINITCGIAIISVASPLAQDLVKLSPTEAAAIVGLMGVFNGLGRIAWASFSDVIGRPATYITFFALQIVLFMVLPKTGSALAFQIILLMIITCYGGGFASIPAFISDVFGTKQLGAIHGYMLTAWAAAGLVGSTLIAKVKEATGSYETTLMFFTGLFVVALVVSIITKVALSRALGRGEKLKFAGA